MKYLFLILILTTSIFAKETVEVNIKTKLSIPDDFKIGLEEQLIKSGYIICIKNGCNKINKQIKIDIVKKSKSVYRFKATFIDLKNKKVISVSSIYFKHSLNDFEKLSKLGQEITFKLINNINKAIVQKNKEAKKAKKRETAKRERELKLERELAKMEQIQKNLEQRNDLNENMGSSAAEQKFYEATEREPHIINNFY